MIQPPRNIPRGALFVLAAALALAVSGPAAASTAKSSQPCWRVLINDWYDGRIDGTYPIHCYRDALKKLPTDVDTYSSARDDIQQALQERITQGRKGGGSGGSGSTTTTGGGTGGGGGGSNGNGTSGPSGSGGGGSDGGSGTGPFKKALNAGKPGKADSVPVPLIVLGGVALLLMAAGGAGFLARRTRTRKLQLASAATLPQRPVGSPTDRQ